MQVCQKDIDMQICIGKQYIDMYRYRYVKIEITASGQPEELVTAMEECQTNIDIQIGIGIQIRIDTYIYRYVKIDPDL